MKKCLFYLCLVALCLCCFTGCETNYYKLLLNNASEIRYNLFVQDDQYVTATFMSGQREEPYVSDGISNALKDFGVFTVKFKSNVSVAEITFEATIDGHTYTGVMEKNPYELNTYATDIEVVVADQSNIKLIYVVSDVARSIQLKNAMSEWQITCFDALKQASTELQPFIKQHTKNSDLQAEVYVKIAFDTSNNLSPYFWLVQIVATDSTSSQLVIDPLTNEILVKTNAVAD